MRITGVNLPKGAVANNGLEQVSMKRLGSVVVLAGPNGSGKTRLLGKLREVCRLPIASPSEKAVIKARIYGLKEKIGKGTRAENEVRERELRMYELRLGAEEWIACSSPGRPVKCMDWVPKNLKLRDSNEMSRGAIERSYGECEKPGIDHLHEMSLASIQHIQDMWHNVTHQGYHGSERQAVGESYDRLVALVRDLLGTSLGRDTSGNVLLFGRTGAQAGLSDGQKVLLQFCVGLHAQGGTLSDTILLMDEPENHLHPAVLVDVIARIQERLTDGQMWIATHSLPLIAQFDPECVWYMDNGRVSQAGESPERVLNGLIGDENRVHKLLSFVDLPASYAANRFAFQCLLPPETVAPREGDPQMEQVKAELAAKGVVRILDVGAGQGRLASTLCDEVPCTGGGESVGWDYVAYDCDRKDQGACEAAIARLCGTAEGRWFDDLHKVIDARGEGCFDVVVMCNVLHEIEPGEWLELFAWEGPLVRLIAEDGCLLVVEDQRMPVGEKAHSKGFLVLDTDDLRTLFGIAAKAEGFVVRDERGDGRLKAHVIARRHLAGITADSRRKVVTHLARRARDEVKKLRDAAPTFPNGRLHAFWVQQLANATLMLGELGDV